MNYRGVIIEESFGNKSILDKVKIIESKIEQVTPRHKTSWFAQWTLLTVEILEEEGEEVAEEICHSFDPQHPNNWYADYKNNKYHFIIFEHKIFKVDLQNPILYKKAKEYGIS